MSLSQSAVIWLDKGERCPSSETMFTYLTGVDALEDKEPAHPTTLEEIRRCRLLLDGCPDIAMRLTLMCNVSREWAALSAFWSDICVMQDLEDPDWRSKAGKARETLTMLNTIIGTQV